MKALRSRLRTLTWHRSPPRHPPPQQQRAAQRSASGGCGMIWRTRSICHLPPSTTNGRHRRRMRGRGWRLVARRTARKAFWSISPKMRRWRLRMRWRGPKRRSVWVSRRERWRRRRALLRASKSARSRRPRRRRRRRRRLAGGTTKAGRGRGKGAEGAATAQMGPRPRRCRRRRAMRSRARRCGRWRAWRQREACLRMRQARLLRSLQRHVASKTAGAPRKMRLCTAMPSWRGCARATPMPTLIRRPCVEVCSRGSRRAINTIIVPSRPRRRRRHAPTRRNRHRVR